MERFAVLIDLSSVRMGIHMLEYMIDDIRRRGEIAYFKLYNFSEKKHVEFRHYIEDNHIEIAPSMQGKKRVRIDIRECIDAVKVISQDETITHVLLIASEVDALYLIDTLRDLGRHVIIAGTSPNTLSEHADEFYLMDRSTELLDDVAIDDLTEPSINGSENLVRGDAESIFPYSDIDSSDIDAKMQEIDRRILAVIESTRTRRNYKDIFGEK